MLSWNTLSQLPEAKICWVVPCRESLFMLSGCQVVAEAKKLSRALLWKWVAAKQSVISSLTESCLVFIVYCTYFCIINSTCWLYLSVAEPPLFYVAPAPDGQGPGANSGSDLLGSAPAPGKKRWLQAKRGGSRRLRLHTRKFFILIFQKVKY